MAPKKLNVEVLAQPDDSVCGPTSLHALYSYFDHEIPLQQVIREIQELPQGGGTLAVQLGCHALSQGFQATLYTNNLQTFDPTWFFEGVDLAEKLRAQAERKQDEKLRLASSSYIEFLSQGGAIKLENLTAELLRSYIDRGIPVLAGLSATYLYECPRERSDGTYDDIGGSPTGHFVVIQGYSKSSPNVLVADPLANNPGFQEHYYSVSIERLLAAIHLGIVTFDANLLVVTPSATSP